MRILVFFDLPVKSPSQRRQATRFRKFLLKDGFYMVQYSVYARVCNGQDAVKKHCQRVRTQIPNQGSVRVLTITEKQYQNIDIILGNGKDEDKPSENDTLTIF